MKRIIGLIFVMLVCGVSIINAVSPSPRTRALRASRSNIKGISQIGMQQLDRAKKGVEEWLTALDLGTIDVEEMGMAFTLLDIQINDIKKLDTKVAGPYESRLESHKRFFERKRTSPRAQPTEKMQEMERAQVAYAQTTQTTNELLQHIQDLSVLIQNIETTNVQKPAGYNALQQKAVGIDDFMKSNSSGFDISKVGPAFAKIIELANEKANARSQDILKRGTELFAEVKNRIDVLDAESIKNLNMSAYSDDPFFGKITQFKDIVDKSFFELVGKLPFILSGRITLSGQTLKLLTNFARTLEELIISLHGFSMRINKSKPDQALQNSFAQLMNHIFIPVRDINDMFKSVVKGEAKNERQVFASIKDIINNNAGMLKGFPKTSDYKPAPSRIIQTAKWTALAGVVGACIAGVAWYFNRPNNSCPIDPKVQALQVQEARLLEKAGTIDVLSQAYEQSQVPSSVVKKAVAATGEVVPSAGERGFIAGVNALFEWFWE